MGVADVIAHREREVRAIAMELRGVVRLDDHADDYAGTLSGGQRKLLEFARALMTEPQMVMLDEPMAGVNPTLGLQLLEHMRRLRNDLGVIALWRPGDPEAELELVGLKLDFCRTRLASGEDAEWIARRLTEACEPLGTRAERLAEQRFRIVPVDSPPA